MRERVFITGIGCVSSFGVGHAAFADALMSGATGIAPISTFDTSRCRSHRAALVRDFDPAAFIPPLKLRRVDEVGRLALACAALAFDDAGWQTMPGGTDDIGVALGTFSAGLDSTVAYLQGLAKDGPAGVPALLFSNTVSNAPASLCAIERGLRGPNVTFNQREASSLAAVAFAAAAVRDGRVSAMLTGGVDQVEEVFFKVHDRFHALSPNRVGGDEAARPFDRRRNGFVLGAGGFTFLAESASSASRRGARVYGEVLGIGATSSKTTVNGWPKAPSGPREAMVGALADAGIGAREVSAVFAAANGSPALDALEAQAIAEVVDAGVPVTSIKGAVGESGAAPAAAIIAAVLAVPTSRVPPTTGCERPDPSCAVSVRPGVREVSGAIVLVNAIASGGTNYSVVLRAGPARQP
jgi:3-oxoacyl-[acyl-carrier-protein] synthase II